MGPLLVQQIKHALLPLSCLYNRGHRLSSLSFLSLVTWHLFCGEGEALTADHSQVFMGDILTHVHADYHIPFGTSGPGAPCNQNS